MILNYLKNTWRLQKIYHTQVLQEMWIGVFLTAVVYYKISYGGKKKVASKPSDHH